MKEIQIFYTVINKLKINIKNKALGGILMNIVQLVKTFFILQAKLRLWD